MKKIFMFMVMIMVIFCMNGCSENTEISKTISVEEVNNIIENFENVEDAFIIDVREENEYEEGHLINSYNIPLSGLATITNIETIKSDSKIIVYCKSGNRSKTAQVMLEELGYTEVYDMGGILDWPYDIVK